MKNTVWLVLLLAGSADAALAQTTSSRPPSIGAAPRVNAGAPARRIGIRAAVDVSYDSNVLGISDSAILTGRSKDDIQIAPSLQLDLVLPFGRQSAFLRGQIGYDFYLNNSRLNRERIILDGGVNLAVLGSCSTGINGSFGRYRSNSGDIFIATPSGIDIIRNVETRTSIGGQVQCGSSIGLSPSISYRHTEVRNSSDFLERNDSNQDAIEGSLGYQRPSLGRISVYGSYAKGEYPGRDVNFFDARDPRFNPDALDGVTSYSTGLRFERDIGSRASGAVSIGYTWVDPESANSRKFRGSSYSLSLALRPTDRLSVDLLASRSAELSNTIFATYSITEVYSLNGTYRLNPKVALNFGSSHQIRDYRGNAPVIVPLPGDPFPIFITNDKFTRAYGGFVYDLNRRLRLNGLVSQQRRNSDNSRFDYKNTTVSLGVSYSLGR